MSTISDEENNMVFEKESFIRVRRYAEDKKDYWGYLSSGNPGFVLACERPTTKGIYYQIASSPKCPQDDGLKWWENVTQDKTFKSAERWRKGAFEKLGIEKGRIITAVLFPDERFNREFESQLYHWWATQREFMIGEFVCLHV